MIEDNNWLMASAKGKSKKRIIGWTLAALGAMTPVLLVILIVILLGSGLFGAFSMVGGFLDGLFGSSDTQTLKDKTAMLSGMTEEEILELMESDKIDESVYETMMINKEEFQYLLEQVQEYNSQDVTRNIEIECKHTYSEWVEDETKENGGYYEQITEYPYRTITVRSADIEKFHLDWQLVYALCLTDTMTGVEDWARLAGTGEGEKGTMVHYGTNHEEIDYIISHVRMNYEYVTDLARSTKESYSMDECRALAHTKYQYGDLATEEGEWLFFYPHSLLERAYSGYSCMYYLVSEDGSTLYNLITASDVNHFDLIIERFCPNYNFGYFSMILGFIPGAEDLKNRLSHYYANRESGTQISDWELNYTIGDGINRSRLPTSTERIETEFGDLTDYGDLVYDETVGGNIVQEAMTKVGSAYNQNNRWAEGVYDCSSFVWRVLKAVGIDLAFICKGSTAAEECRGMVNAGMLIAPDQIKQGDIIFYSGEINGRYRNVTHVAIYAGGGKIVHASNPRDGVKVSDYYKTGLVCVCRPYGTE